ncbi:hypothetical protein ID866_6738 [Astraeus odoratus]|nr:hypothetical protein ID866_6738 [Astraeus odoratus]
MRIPLVSLVTLSLSLLTFANPALSPYVVHEKRSAIPHGWSLARRHDASSTLPLSFALKQRNIESISDFLFDVSHPDSPSYGKHWSAGEIADKFAPSRDTIETVREWLLDSGIDADRIRLSGSNGWIRVDVSVDEAERLMHTEYNIYKHESGTEHVACEAYHLPEHVSYHVDFVLPSIHFDAKLGKRDSSQSLAKVGVPGSGFAGPKTTGTFHQTITELQQCDKYTTPQCLRALYGFYYEPQMTQENSYGIVEYTPQAFIESDLQIFAANFSQDLLGKSPQMVSIDGGYYQTQMTGFEYNVESNLDLQYGMALVTGDQPVTLYQVGDVQMSASFNNFLDAIDGSYCTFEGGDDPSQDGVYPDPSEGGYKGKDCGTVKPTSVISTSYGYNEADLSPFYAARQCAEYAKLGLKGITVLYSSGDNGVAGNQNTCLNPDGTQSSSGTRFNPTFPAVCPWVTAIGATMMKPNATVFQANPEQACDEVIYSGGGFSNYFGVPDYQKGAVSGWMNNQGKGYVAEYPNAWNSTGSRGFPDVSANGANYVVAVDGEYLLIYGTSASAPVFGAILTMVNDARLLLNKSPIGFINPAIYSELFDDAFTDITEGNNPGCGTDGFNATQGWDPVTGLGTPKFLNLLANFLLLP